MADIKVKSINKNANNEAIRLLVSPLSDDYSPSISDRTKAGYFSQDGASQTERSDLINLKEMTSIVGVLVQDLAVVKKSLYYARHVLEADYKTKLEERGLKLYCRVNDRIIDLEKMHQERVCTIRRCFKQQLSDALAKITNENEKMSQEMLARSSRLADKRQQEELRKNDKGKLLQQQQAMILMLKMQLQEQQEKAERELDEAMMASSTPSPLGSLTDNEELISKIEDLESKLDDMHIAMDDVKAESRQLVREVDDLTDQLGREREITSKLKGDLNKANLEVEEGKTTAKTQLEKQKVDLIREYEDRMVRLKEDLNTSARRQLDEFQLRQHSKLKEQDMLNQRLMQEAMAKKEKVAVPESEKDVLIRELQQTETKLRAELASLHKELARANRTWEMKVSVLKQSIHALRDEAFLRASLQKQSTKLRHAAVTYSSDGPLIIPVEPIPVNQRYKRLPAPMLGEVKVGVVPDIVPRRPGDDV